MCWMKWKERLGGYAYVDLLRAVILRGSNGYSWVFTPTIEKGPGQEIIKDSKRHELSPKSPGWSYSRYTRW